MRTQIFILLVAISLLPMSVRAESLQDTNRTISEALLKFASLVNLTNLTEADARRLADAAKKFVEMKEQNKLPKFEKDEKGTGSIYPLTKETQEDWVKDQIIDQHMADDIADCKYAYLCTANVKSNKFFYFLCLNHQDELKLVSAYRYQETNWVRLPIDEIGSKEPKQ